MAPAEVADEAQYWQYVFKSPNNQGKNLNEKIEPRCSPFQDPRTEQVKEGPDFLKSKTRNENKTLTSHNKNIKCK